MNKITSFEIKSFRNIVFEKIDIQKDTKLLAIKGKNGLGKTNRIEALLWCLGGVLLDGTARDTMGNIEPTDAPLGTTISVKVFFNDGQSIEKQYSRQYFTNDDGVVVPKDSKTQYIINGGKPTTKVSEGIQFIYEQLGLTSLQNKFNGDKLLSKVNLVYLLYTTLGLATFDNATMRALMIDVVGDVSAIDVAKNNVIYKELIPFLEQARDDINKVRDDLRFNLQDKNNGLEVRKNNAQKVLEELEFKANIEIDENEIKNAQIELEKIDNEIMTLEVKKEQVRSGDTSKIELEIAQLEKMLIEEKQKIKDAYELEIKQSSNVELENQIKNKEDAIFSETHNTRVKQSELEVAENKLKMLEQEKENKTRRANEIIELVKNLANDYKNSNDNSKNDDTKITCPHCEKQFLLSETKEQLELHKVKIEQENKKLETKRDELKIEFDDVKLSIIEIDLRIAKGIEYVAQKRGELTNSKANREVLENELASLRETLRKTTLIVPELNLNTKEVLELISKINTLKTKKNEVLLNIEKVLKDFDDEITNLKEQKETHNLVIDKKRVKEANLKTLEPQRIALDNLNRELIKTSDLYALSKSLLVDTFRELEKRIELKFGKDIYFKLYEPNATDGGQTYKTTVCEMFVRDDMERLVPALSNGVSTSMREVRIAEFVDKLREHYGLPKGFILIDRLESLDDEKIKLLLNATNNLIITAKATNDKIIMYENII